MAKQFTQTKEERIMFFKLRKETHERNKKALHDLISSFCLWISILVKMTTIALFCSMAGFGSLFLIYFLNKPLGIAYAVFFSYAVAGLLGVLLSFLLSNNSKETND